MESFGTIEPCVVCCRDVNIYAVGVCDHPICYVCSTRLRVLCKLNECPICRRDLPKVYFSLKKLTYVEVAAWKKIPFNGRYKIGFENPTLQFGFNKLLQHPCKECPSDDPLPSFNKLKEHMRKIHEKIFCDLCVDHLRIFTFERKCYSRIDLAKHRRIGDADDTSHKGHPLCEFCDDRFMDNDELYKHLRRDHFFCHFCDNDGSNQYYGDYHLLRNHYRSNHFLCEEEDCINEKFTSVFRSEIDLKAHKYQCHAKLMSKNQAKQARNLEIEFAFAPRSNNNQYENNFSRNSSDRNMQPDRSRSSESGQRNNSNLVNASMPVMNKLDMENEQEFPSLSGSAQEKNSTSGQNQNAKTLAHKIASNNKFSVRGYGGRSVNDDDFPSLTPSVTVEDVKPFNVKKNNAKRVPTSSKNSLRYNNNEDFPALGKPNSTSNKSSNEVSKSYSENVQQRRVISSQNIVLNHNKPDNMESKKEKAIERRNTVPTKEDFPSLGSSHGQNSIVHSQITPRNSNNVPNVTIKSDNIESNKKKVMELRKTVPTKEDFPSLGSSHGQNSIVYSQITSRNSNNVPNVIMKSENIESNKKKVKELRKTVPTKEDFPSLSSTHGKNSVVHSQNTSSNSNNIPNVTNKSKKKGKKSVKNEDQLNSNRTNFESKNSVLTSSNSSKLIDEENISIKSTDKPPPGFNIKVAQKTCSAPPGFKSSIPPGFTYDTNDVPSLKFTENRGKDYLLTASEATYSEPNSFKERNHCLISTIKSVLNEDETKFGEFKSLSMKFRKNEVTANTYYVKCLEMIGRMNFKVIFPELLVLLPEIRKQQELLQIHKTFQRSESISKGAKLKDSAWIANSEFLVCAACQQVLSNEDFKNHMIMHNLENNFPSLPNSISNTAIRKTT